MISSINHQTQKPTKIKETNPNGLITPLNTGGPLHLMAMDHFLFKCRICRCRILQKGAFDLCLGCAKDYADQINETIKRKGWAL